MSRWRWEPRGEAMLQPGVFRLDRAALCPTCQVIVDLRAAVCPVCCSEHLHPLVAWLGTVEEIR